MILKHAASYPQDCPFGGIKESDASWFAPQLVCTVKYMMRTTDGLMRQPVFKGLSMDKAPEDCIIE
jgi:ATP-dependent DNA ligase